MGRFAARPPLRVIRGKGSLEIVKALAVLAILFVLLFSPTVTWSQTPVTEPSNPAGQAQQSPTPQSKPVPAPPAKSGTVSAPDQAAAPQTAAPQTAAPQAVAPQNKKKKKDDTEGQQSKRMFWLVPNFGAVNADTQLPPMTTRQKFVLASKDSITDYSSYTWTGILAEQALLLNSDPELGQGFAGYGRYYWRAFTDGVSGTFFTEAIVPALTHEDPRYYTLGKGGFFHRTAYAISRAFVTKTDSGGSAFNWSEVGGNALEAGLSNAYYPPQERGLSQTAVNWATQMESAVLNHVFQEFWPDIRKNVFRQK
ncbi:MAG: hypothetical protein ACYDD2_16020 [Candidatus Acidiferrales bacterium]